jgi:hypothetical protein
MLCERYEGMLCYVARYEGMLRGQASMQRGCGRVGVMWPCQPPHVLHLFANLMHVFGKLSRPKANLGRGV